MPVDIVIYHNPECGTSRNTLAMIRNAGIEPHVVEYLKTPPSRAMLVLLLDRMGSPPRALLREKGTPFAELGLDDATLSDDRLIDAMMEHPILINRPIVVSPLGVKLCRPSEEVLDLLPSDQRGAFTKEDGERVVDERLRLLDLVAGGVDETEPTHGQGRRLRQLVGGNVDQLQATAAEIAGSAIGIDETHHDALSGELGFALTGQDLDAHAQRLLGPSDELGSVRGLAHGCGRQGADVLDLEDSGDGAKARERGQGPVDGIGAELAGGSDGLAEAAEHLLVEERRRRANSAFVYDEAHRIRADVYNADGLQIMPMMLLAEQAFQARQNLPCSVSE